MLSYLKKLEDRKKNGSLRSLSSFQGMVDFYSNDYLGIANQAVPTLTNSSGSTGSRLISGNSPEAIKAESFLADFYQSEAALIFNSGYDANIGLFSAVPQRGDLILYDEFIHASVRDGIRLSHAKAYSFKHNDFADLRKKLEAFEGTIFVAVESLYSMDGDLSPLKHIAEICQEFNALLIVDEAHSGGVFGKEGRGLCEELQIEHLVFARLLTFGKAYGTHGAVVLGSETLKSYLVNFARSFIYTTALPPYQYEHITQQVEKSKTDLNRLKLQENIDLFRGVLGDKISFSDARSPIQVVLIPGVEEVSAVSKLLQNNLLAVKAIMSPTVAEGQERLRVCLHSFDCGEDILRLGKLILRG
jgi:8-amino-7-oxononanoate synthase